MSTKTFIDMSAHMKSTLMCDTFLRVAESQYADLLPSIRTDVARAMSGWLVLFGYRPAVQWSDEDECFIGCLRNAGGDFVSFHDKTATGFKEEFEKAVRNYMLTRSEERNAGKSQHEAERDIAA